MPVATGGAHVAVQAIAGLWSQCRASMSKPDACSTAWLEYELLWGGVKLAAALNGLARFGPQRIIEGELVKKITTGIPPGFSRSFAL